VRSYGRGLAVPNWEGFRHSHSLHERTREQGHYWVRDQYRTYVQSPGMFAPGWQMVECFPPPTVCPSHTAITVQQWQYIHWNVDRCYQCLNWSIGPLFMGRGRTMCADRLLAWDCVQPIKHLEWQCRGKTAKAALRVKPLWETREGPPPTAR